MANELAGAVCPGLYLCLLLYKSHSIRYISPKKKKKKKKGVTKQTGWNL